MNTQNSSVELSLEHRRSIIDCLRNAGVKNTHVKERFVHAVVATVQQWKREKVRESTFRVQHKSLRELWQLVNAPDPEIWRIRARLQTLPDVSRDYILRRARALWPKAFSRMPCCDLSIWAQGAPSGRLLSRLSSSIPEGGVIITGRNRDGSKRSASRFEPVIMGMARGSGWVSSGRGRPRGDDELRLIAYLAVDWTLATGAPPVRGRSSSTPFGDLVHYIFSCWEKNAKADQALRRYWAEVERRRNKPAGA
jgi:hypothetical protein